MEKERYLRATQLSDEMERNENLIDELTSWLESERFEGATMYFVNGEGEHRTIRVFLGGELGRDVVEYARRRVNQVLRKQNKEFKNL